MSVFDIMMLLMLALASEHDLRTRTIPIYETAPMFLLAIVKTVVHGTYPLAKAGMLFTLVLYIWIVLGKRKVLGGADFRILAALAVYCGLQGVAIIVIMSCFAIPAVKLVMRDTVEISGCTYLYGNDARKHIPYAPALLFGSFICFSVPIIA